MLVFGAIPGPGVMATIARALASGFKPAAFLVFGVVLGDLSYLMLAIYGLSAVADSVGHLFVWVKIAGGLYLFVLAINLWRYQPERVALESNRDDSLTGNFMTGLLITLSNPKVIVFYLGFLPTFIDLRAITFSDMLIIIALVICCLLIVMLAYAYAAEQARQLLNSHAARARLNRCAAAVMGLASLSLLLDAL